MPAEALRSRNSQRAWVRSSPFSGADSQNDEIAAQLIDSNTTVRTRLGRVLRKLGLRVRIQAVVLASGTGLVRPS
jgi:hypothetical protein